MSFYGPDEIDPETIRITVDAPFLENLQDLTEKAIRRARYDNKVAVVHHYRELKYADVPAPEPGADVVPDAVAAEPAVVGYQDFVGFRDYEPDMFEKGEFQCPRDADAEWEAQNKAPRPFPSIMVARDLKDPASGKVSVVVSKPSLCDSCEHSLSRKLKGMCPGLRFTPLQQLQVAS